MSRDAGNERPDRSDEDLLQEALLLSAGMEELDSAGAPDDAGPEMPEEVLGLLDGTASPEEAERARSRLAADPDLAREFGRVTASLARMGEDPISVEAPAELTAEALAIGGAVPGIETARPRRADASRWLGWDALRQMFAGPRAPLFAAGAAAILLVTFAVRDSDRHEPTPTSYRAAPEAPRPVERRTPEDGSELRPGTRFEWAAVEGATSYRVILVDPRGGEMLELGPTVETSLAASPARLEKAFPGRESREVLWTVRALLLDGTEVSSSPGELRWEGASR